jgi:hypothetical protein
MSGREKALDRAAWPYRESEAGNRVLVVDDDLPSGTPLRKEFS